MLSNVMITMRSVQAYDTDEADTLDFETEGYYTFTDNVGCVTYMETEVTGLQGTRTSVFVMEDCVVVDREGPVTSRMIFREGDRSNFAYETPYGQATLGIRTNSITKHVDAAGGSVDVDYVLDVEHAVVARNKFCLTIRPDGGMNNGEPDQ